MIERRKQQLTESDISSIADSLHARLKGEATSSFYIPPEDHYNAHKNLSEMYRDWKSLKNAFAKAFMGFVIVGLFAFAIAGVVVEGGRHILNFLKGS